MLTPEGAKPCSEPTLENPKFLEIVPGKSTSQELDVRRKFLVQKSTPAAFPLSGMKKVGLNLGLTPLVPLSLFDNYLEHLSPEPLPEIL